MEKFNDLVRRMVMRDTEPVFDVGGRSHSNDCVNWDYKGTTASPLG